MTGKDTSLNTDNVGVTHAVVLKLLKGLEHRGHHIYMDNYYCPVPRPSMSWVWCLWYCPDKSAGTAPSNEIEAAERRDHIRERG